MLSCLLTLCKAPDSDPLAPHKPTKIAAHAVSTQVTSVMPGILTSGDSLLDSGNRLDTDEFVADLYEWLSLLRLQSPRAEAGDVIDPYLSRYQIPSDPERRETASICKISWQGLLSSSWARQVLLTAILTLPPKSWFAMSVSTFSSTKGLAGDGRECTIMRPPKAPGELFLWEIKSHE